MSTERSLSRRRFVRLAAGTTGALGAASTATAAQEAQTHTVEMTDSLVFDPDSITIAPGDTIEWVNVGEFPHSVTAYEEDIPADAEYFASGGLESEAAAREDWGGSQEGSIEGGESYSHTFEVEGTYEYFCIPHEGAGMLGEVEVTADAGGGEGGGAAPQIPDTAKTIGVGTVGAMTAVLAITLTVLKYGGGAPDE